MKLRFIKNSSIALALMMVGFSCQTQEDNHSKTIEKYHQTTNIPEGILTPDKVSTSIGDLEFIDGAPLPETAEKVYENLDRMRGVDVFLKCMPAVSVRQLMVGPAEIGVDDYNKVLLFDKLMDSKPLYLTANTSTLYSIPSLNMKNTGPMVIEVPKGMLGAFNDAWFRYMEDIGPFGPDKAQGGKYLVIPPDYEGEIPSGYYVVKSKTYRVWIFMRAFIENGIDAAVANIKNNLKIYPLSEKNNPKPMEFISGTGKEFNTIHTNDFHFYEHLNEVIQEEPYEMLDAETRGLIASIGIEKGKEFAPDARMKRILTDAVAIGNATARSIVWYPRSEGSVSNMKGIKVFPTKKDSHWIMAWVDRNVFFNGKDGHTMNSDARVMFHYPYTAVTPAMAVPRLGIGSDYAMAYVDDKKVPFDGSKNYKLHIPPNPPAKNFWAVTVYDPQTRSMLQTDQAYPTVGSQTEGLRKNEDGSYDIYFGPKAPKGYESNWLQTIPGKSMFVILRLYGPLQEWHDRKWVPSNVTEIKN
ncbi:DUF1254 domain-containing protein [Flammeovirga sp. MY04]|uniref:DUF1254 domain-containing protein n=1 Tax=Flammeovirga sp. MY04 TaxID=1191459 RepID=UPI0008244200|nr:DUF1254 domain-containing protein [Flammeovirga sp. MY04]